MCADSTYASLSGVSNPLQISCEPFLFKAGLGRFGDFTTSRRQAQ
jgi:hypothetical protein